MITKLELEDTTTIAITRIILMILEQYSTVNTVQSYTEIYGAMQYRTVQYSSNGNN